jgi:dienelactone hydrolase
MAPKPRLLKVFDQFTARLADAPRLYSFHENDTFSEWKTRFKAKLLELLSPFPEPVPLNPEILEEEVIEDYEEYGIPPFRLQKIVYDSEKYASVVAYLLIPLDLAESEQRPAILVAHGHGVGKAKMVNMDPQYWITDGISVEAPAIHLVKEGFVVLAPDWRPFGERGLDKNYTRAGRDPCNVTAMSFEYFGYKLLTLNIWDAFRSLDLLQSLPFVDPNQIGMIGKSYGGTMTAYTAALDARIKAAVISGYLSTLNDAMSMRALGNYCGAQYLPGLLNWGDIPDVVGLIAPRPLLIEAGEKDDCFIFEDATIAFEKVQRIYQAAGVSDRLSRSVAPVKHEYIFDQVLPFFQKNL